MVRGPRCCRGCGESGAGEVAARSGQVAAAREEQAVLLDAEIEQSDTSPIIERDGRGGSEGLSVGKVLDDARGGLRGIGALGHLGKETVNAEREGERESADAESDIVGVECAARGDPGAE